ncbi:MAG TPA: nucleotidyltransferase domain-containing protein [Candidatus Krumholzibacteria bacterium]|jgi:predicted nucleotidyltransferase
MERASENDEDARAADPSKASHRKLEELRGPIKRAVRAVEPDAEIILYGSRARGTAQPDSDWDLLILVDGPVDSARKTSIRHRIYEVEWDSDEVLTSMIFSREDWNSPLYRAMPFHQNVERDGLTL